MSSGVLRRIREGVPIALSANSGGRTPDGSFRRFCSAPLMTYVVGILIVVLCVAAACAASLIVDRRVSLAARRRHHEVGNQVFQLIGVMFSVILAFVFNEVWSEYNVAKQAISSECEALHSAALLANALPDGKGRPIIESIYAYTNLVVHSEWKIMAKERRSLDAARELRASLYTAAQLRVTDPGDLANRAQIVSLLTQAHAQRETRTFQLKLGMPSAMWTVLVLIAVILVAFMVLSGTEQPATLIFAGCFTASIAMVLVLVRMLDFPFEGALAIGNGDFVKLNGLLAATLASGQ